RLTDEMSGVVIYLVPVGSGRFELYSEAPADREAEPGSESDGFWRRLARRAQAGLRDAVHSARHADPHGGLLTRARNAVVCKAAEAIAEQRALWALRHGPDAELVHPSDLSAPDAAVIRDRMINRARAHHLRWLAIDAVVFVASGVFMIVPGPNLIAY